MKTERELLDAIHSRLTIILIALGFIAGTCLRIAAKL
jgi:hypothetical protein